MSLYTERLRDAIWHISSETILQYAQEYDHPYGVIAVVDSILSRDFSYADIVVEAQNESASLPRFLSPLAREIHRKISRDLWLKKTPKIRFRTPKKSKTKKDVLELIQELDTQYGLSR